MINKKGFSITPLEIMKLSIVLVFGIFAWFFYSGVEQWVESYFKFSAASMIWTGLFGLALMLLLFKSNVLKLVI